MLCFFNNTTQMKVTNGAVGKVGISKYDTIKAWFKIICTFLGN